MERKDGIYQEAPLASGIGLPRVEARLEWTGPRIPSSYSICWAECISREDRQVLPNSEAQESFSRDSLEQILNNE